MDAPKDILAFPFQAAFGSDVMEPDFGMTLRDWIAGSIAAAMLDQAKPDEVGGDPVEMAKVVARASYRFADIMLAVRLEKV